jgi:hypothetical protein
METMLVRRLKKMHIPFVVEANITGKSTEFDSQFKVQA